MFISVK